MLKKLNTEHELLLRQHYKNEIQRIFCNMFDNLDESAQHEILRTFSTSDKKKLYKYLKNNAVLEHDKFKALVYKSCITQSKTTTTAFGLSCRRRHRSRLYYYSSR